MSELPNIKFRYGELPKGEFNYSDFPALFARYIRHQFGRFVNANSDDIPKDFRTEENGIKWFAELIGEDFETVKALTRPIDDSNEVKPSAKILHHMGATLNEERIIVKRTVEQEVSVWSVSIGTVNDN